MVTVNRPRPSRTNCVVSLNTLSRRLGAWWKRTESWWISWHPGPAPAPTTPSTAKTPTSWAAPTALKTLMTIAMWLWVWPNPVCVCITSDSKSPDPNDPQHYLLALNSVRVHWDKMLELMKNSLTGGLLWGWSLAVDFSIGTPCPEKKLLAPCSQPLDCCHSTGSASSVWGWVPSKTGLTSIPLQTLQLQAPFLHTFAPPHLRFWNKNTSTHPTPPWSFDSIFYVLTFSTHTIHTSNILPTDHGCVMEEVEAVTDAETGTGFLPVLFPSSCHCCSTWLHRPLMSAAAYQWFPYMHAGGVLVHLFGITCILLGSVIFPPWFKIKLVLFF